MRTTNHEPSGAGDERLRILVVEDEALILMSVLDMVEELGYTGVGASNAAAALAELDRGTAFHAMIADISLPDMAGQDLARVARERCGAIPVIFSTGHRIDVPPELAAGGPTTVLGKPYWTDQLAEALSRVAEDTRQLP